MKKAIFIPLAILIMTLTVAARVYASPECLEVGRKYQQLGMKAGSMKNYSEAADWLEKAVRTCPSYENYHLLGRSQQNTGNYEKALNAYKEAQALAKTPDDQAMSVARYGQVLNLMSHPIEALPLIQAAREMHSSPPSWVTELALELDDSMANRKFTVDEINRSGLRESSSSGFLTIAGLAPVAKGDTSDRKPKRTINYKINFDFDSTKMDSLSLDNVRTLARVLTSHEYSDKSVWLIGHSDVRGKEQYNQQLSERRAEAVYGILISMEPSLKAKLRTKGMGESKPLYYGNSERVHRNNRRLQVVLE